MQRNGRKMRSKWDQNEIPGTGRLFAGSTPELWSVWPCACGENCVCPKIADSGTCGVPGSIVLCTTKEAAIQ